MLYLVDCSTQPSNHNILESLNSFSVRHLDRRAFIDIITAGQGDIGGVMQPAPAGLWGMPPEMLNSLPGYDPDVQKNRAESRQIMKMLGYSRDNHLKIKVTVRDIPYYRDPGVLLIDQLQQVYIDGELEPVDTTNFFPKMMRKDYNVGLNLQGAGDPDQTLPLLYGCVQNSTATITVIPT
jgi:peptide/nickel transport system substrate-binding protein